MKTEGRQLHCVCTKGDCRLSSKATVRASSEILAIRAILKHLSENKNNAMCVVLLRLVKT